MTLSKITDYLLLEESFEEIHHLNNILSIISWDHATYMPSNSATSRQKEMATLSSIIHRKVTAGRIIDLIKASELENQYLDKWQQANLREIKRAYAHASCIDDKLNKKFTEAANNCEYLWRDCKKNNDFDGLEPHLQEVINLSREIAHKKSQHFNILPYDTLIDIYEPGSKSDKIRSIYSLLKTKLPNLIQIITEKQANEVVLPITEKVSAAQQKLIGKRIMEAMEFDFSHGRLDESAHPFCGGTSTDIRLTTRYDENNFISGLMGIIHETGHGLYELNLPSRYQYQPVGNAKGMAFHESQSLIMEMQAGTSKEFIEFLARILKDEFGFKAPEYSSENLFKIVTRVTPGFIRVDADEVTYPLHVVLRFEIEEALFKNEIQARDLPHIWNMKMNEYLGIVPDSFSNGCLQDIHWPGGSFGYFPAYTNGAMIASMLMASAKNQYNIIPKELQDGSFNHLNIFLNENIRSFASFKTPQELLKDATGFEEVQPNIFIDYLTRKYL